MELRIALEHHGFESNPCTMRGTAEKMRCVIHPIPLMYSQTFKVIASLSPYKGLFFEAMIAIFKELVHTVVTYLSN